MNQFLSSFYGRQWRDGVHWSTTEKLVYASDVYGMIEVPVNFQTDGGSVPKLFTNIVTPYGRGFRAFALHDMLYYSQMFTRDVADEILREALASCGEGILDDDVQFEAVRLGGQFAWDAHLKNGDPEKFKRGIWPIEGGTIVKSNT